MYFSSLFPSLPPESTPTRLSARWMHFPVCVSLQGHVWHSRQGALEAVDQRDWHSNPRLLPSLMDSICITESIRHFWAFFSIRSFCLPRTKNNSRVFSPTHQHRPQTYPQQREGRECENCRCVQFREPAKYLRSQAWLACVGSNRTQWINNAF